MQCNIPLQNPAQQVTGKQGMEAPVVMQQASSAFNQGEASDEIIDGEVFERQSGVAANGLGVWGALEYLKYFSRARAERGRSTDAVFLRSALVFITITWPNSRLRLIRFQGGNWNRPFRRSKVNWLSPVENRIDSKPAFIESRTKGD
jgi:hypothetical protein